MIPDPQGLIYGPAVRRGNKIFSLSRPARHVDVIAKMNDLGLQKKGTDVEGFMTADGFKDRLLAAEMLGHATAIHTEDLW